MNELKLRDKILSLQTRKFGNFVEKLTEIILKEFGFIVKNSNDLSFDRRVNNFKDEIKGSRVFRKSILNLEDEDNIIEYLLNYESNKYVSIEEEEVEWDCNIQQIKPNLFNTLWYLLFFEDCITLFKISSDLIVTDVNISYSNKQHRGNIGEGQFHINNKNLKYHMDNYLVKKISYTELYTKLDKIKND